MLQIIVSAMVALVTWAASSFVFDENEFRILVVGCPRSIFVIFSFLYSLKEGGQTDYPVIIFVVSQMAEVN